MADLNEKDSSGAVKVVGADSEGNETDYVSVGTKQDETTKGIHTIPESPKGGIETYLRRSDMHELMEEFRHLKEVLINLTTQNTLLSDGIGKGFDAKVNQFNALKVSDQRLPDEDDPTLLIPLRRDFTNDLGSIDMRVDGSVNNVDFVVKADENDDIFVDSISFRIADANAVANKFGNINPLQNGVQLIYSDLRNGENVIGEGLQTNFDFVRLCQGEPSFGDGTNAFKINNASENSEGYIPVLDFSDMFGLPWGIRLKKGTQEKLIIRIRDNTSGVDAFDAIAFGFKKILKGD
jgi:hypothetical protein